MSKRLCTVAFLLLSLATAPVFAADIDGNNVNPQPGVSSGSPTDTASTIDKTNSQASDTITGGRNRLQLCSYNPDQVGCLPPASAVRHPTMPNNR